jgi:Protein of unknown function (DUF2970)
MADQKSGLERKSSALDTFKAVASAFFGVRGRNAHQRDISRLNPVHLIIAGIVMALLFIFVLLAIVRMVVK